MALVSADKLFVYHASTEFTICIHSLYSRVTLGENVSWEFTSMFDCMGALSTSYNDTPDKASRAFDKDRDGFVIAGGGGVMILEGRLVHH